MYRYPILFVLSLVPFLATQGSSQAQDWRIGESTYDARFQIPASTQLQLSDEVASSLRGDFDADGNVDRVRARVSDWQTGVEFLVGAETFSFALDSAVDRLAAADIDADGRDELIAAATGESFLLVLALDPDSGALRGRRVELASPVELIEASEFHREDGRADLAIASRDRIGPVVYFFSSVEDGVFGTPRVERFEDPVLALATGYLDSDVFRDVAVATERQIVLLYGNDTRDGSVHSRPVFEDREIHALPGGLVSLSIDNYGDRASARRLLVKTESGVHRMVTRFSPGTLPTRSLDPVPEADASREGTMKEIRVAQRMQTFTVNSSNDANDGNCNGAHCSLREAILAANATADLDTVQFGNVGTISPTSSLPAITQPISIDGTTSNSGRVGIDGSSLNGGTDNGSGLALQANNSTIKGLAIGSFDDGLELSGVVGATIQNNYFGTTTNGQSANGNFYCGIRLLDADNNQIGGSGGGEGNLASGNFDGICLEEGSSGNTVLGNSVGTNPSGVDRIENSGSGIAIFDSPNNRIGTAVAGNLISGNGTGVNIVNSDGTIVRKSIIGPRASGNSKLSDNTNGNSVGVAIRDSSTATVGGTGNAQKNTISANDTGIAIQGNSAADDNLIQGNRIGVGANGSTSLGNGRGISLTLTTQDNTIGGSAAAANTIANSTTGAGVTMNGAGEGNEVTSNSFFDNDGIGIDIGGPGVNGIDPGDGDGGKNRLQNRPEITRVFTFGLDDLRAIFFVDSSAGNSSYDISVQFYEADSISSGEGKRLLATTTFTVNNFNAGQKTATLGTKTALGIASGDAIVAIATDASGNTSEFSAVKRVDAAKLTVTKGGFGTGTVTSSPGGISCGSDCEQVYTGGETVTLTATPQAGSNFVGWTGDADCSDGQVSMAGDDVDCTATFQPKAILTINKVGSGSGTVTSNPAGINCGGNCSFEFNFGQSVSLTATPAAGSVFVGWGGDGDCSNGGVLMDQSVNCTATFNVDPGAGPEIFDDGFESGNFSAWSSVID